MTTVPVGLLPFDIAMLSLGWRAILNQSCELTGWRRDQARAQLRLHRH